MSILNYRHNLLFGQQGPPPPIAGMPALGPPPPSRFGFGGFIGMLNSFVTGLFCGLAVRTRNLLNPRLDAYNRQYAAGSGIWGVPMDDYGVGLDTLSFQQQMNLFNFPTISSSVCAQFAGSMPSMLSMCSFTPITNFGTAPVSSSAQPTDGNGPEVADGTPITLSDIDYSIFGKDAAEIKKLRPEMQRKVQKMYAYAKSKGWTISLTCGFRSTETQTRIYNAWKAGKHNAPTVAKPGTSRHEFGCAVDIRINGKSQGTREFNEMGKYAQEIGLHWGRSFREDWHFDLDPKSTPKGRSGGSTVAQSSTGGRISYAETSSSDYDAIYNGTYTGDYVKINGVTHFRYEDQNMTSTKSMKKAAADAFYKMKEAMKRETGLTLDYTTAYRGKSHQKQSLNNHTYTKATMGNRFKSVAPMGYSEHHTGYACDITINGNASRNNSDWTSNANLKKAYEWLRNNASRFGFEQSFTKGNAQGVGEEAWHWRYVGDADSQRVFYNARKFAGIVS